MSLSQELWSLDDCIQLTESSLTSEQELEELLQNNIDLLNPDWLVIGRQVRLKNGKILDLLCMDRDEDLVVVELKKDITPREVTAQVIEYASYVAELELDDLGVIYNEFSQNRLGEDTSIDIAFRNKFGVPLVDEQVNQRVKMVIVASKMDDGTEHIIQYLRNCYDVDINILFFKVFEHNNSRLLGRVWYEEDLEDITPNVHNNNWNGEYYVSFGQSEIRNWEEAKQYGFISAGGGDWYTRTLGLLSEGDRIWVNTPNNGYVGVGTVLGPAVDAREAVLTHNEIPTNLGTLLGEDNQYYRNNERIVPVRWINTVEYNQPIREIGFFGNQNTVCRPTSDKWDYTINRLKTLWNIN